MKVYHGSHTKIETIDLSLCRENTDFGQGFYVTKFRRHAEKWADIVGNRNNTPGVVTEFDFTAAGFAERICKIKRFDAYDGEWLDFVVKNRRKGSLRHDYDIVEGPVADDKVQNQIAVYLKGKISKTEFLEMLKYHEETHQICFCTLVALQTLDCIDDTPTLDVVHITEPLLEALILDRNIDEMLAANIFFTSDTFAQLADEKTKLYQKPWQDIYEMLKRETQV